MTFHIGVSGWQYDAWRGDFYPTALPRRRQLEYVGEQFDSVELNGSFYSLQSPRTYRRWHDETPDGFLFAVKGGRYITHFKRLVGAETALANFFASGVLRLEDKLGPLVWQLPERVEYDSAVMADFLHQLPSTTASAAALAARHDAKVRHSDYEVGTDRPLRHAIEPRHASFMDDAFFTQLAEHEVACVVSDSPAKWPLIDVKTTDFAYARLHGHTQLYASRYATRSLDSWAERCRAWAKDGRQVFVFFDNDMHGHAPHDALDLAARLSPALVPAQRPASNLSPSLRA